MGTLEEFEEILTRTARVVDVLFSHLFTKLVSAMMYVLDSVHEIRFIVISLFVFTLWMWSLQEEAWTSCCLPNAATVELLFAVDSRCTWRLVSFVFFTDASAMFANSVTSVLCFAPPWNAVIKKKSRVDFKIRKWILVSWSTVRAQKTCDLRKVEQGKKWSNGSRTGTKRV